MFCYVMLCFMCIFANFQFEVLESIILTNASIILIFLVIKENVNKQSIYCLGSVNKLNFTIIRYGSL